MIKKYHSFVIAVLVVGITLVAYGGVTHLYLFNDEWGQLGGVYRFGMLASLSGIPFAQLLLGRDRLLGSLINNAFFLNFRDNVAPIAIFGLFFHSVNAWLIYILTKRATKSLFISGVAAVFFVSASVVHQSLTWPAATVQTVSSVTFLLLSVYFAFVYRQTRSWKHIALVSLNLYVSFLIKDNTIVLLPVIVALPFMFGQRRLRARNIPWYVWALLVGLILLAIYKTVLYFDLTFSNALTVFMIRSYIRWFVNILFYPVVSVSHLFIPFPFMLKLAHTVGAYYSMLGKPPFAGIPFELLSETMLSDFVSVLLSLGIIAVMYFLCRPRKEYASAVLFFLLLYILNFVPIALFLNERNTSYIESRYLYACLVPFAILVGVTLDSLVKAISRRYRISLGNATVFVCVLFSVYVYKQVIVIRRYVATAIDRSQQIRTTVNLFKRVAPQLPKKPIVYLESDSQYYVGAPVPFQLGPGYILMVIYYPTGVIPNELFVGSKEHYYPFLYNYVDQGYREIGNKGFGYFTDKEKLIALFVNNPYLRPEQVVGFRYYGKEQRMIDITKEVAQTVRDAVVVPHE